MIADHHGVRASAFDRDGTCPLFSDRIRAWAEPCHWACTRMFVSSPTTAVPL